MTWKKLNNAHFGSSTTFGGADIDKISKVFDGTTDIDEQDINSSTTIRSSKLKFRNPVDTYSYTISPSAITADRTITLPTLATDDEFIFENASQTISNKTLSNCTINSPTVTNFPERTIQDPIIKRWGSCQPVPGSTDAARFKGDGILSNQTFFSDPGGGGAGSSLIYAGFLEITGDVDPLDAAGIRPSSFGSAGAIRTAKAGLMRAKISAFWLGPDEGNMSVAIGLFDYTTLPTRLPGQNNFIANGEGVFVRLTGNKSYLSGSGGGDYSNQFKIGETTVDQNLYIYELSWPAGGATATATILDPDGTAVAQVTQSNAALLPSPTTNLWPYIYMYTHDLAQRYFRFYGWWLETE